MYSTFVTELCIGIKNKNIPISNQNDSSFYIFLVHFIVFHTLISTKIHMFQLQFFETNAMTCHSAILTKCTR